MTHVESIYDHAGGEPAIRRFVEVFYASVLADPVLTPLFGEGRPEHVPHLAAFDAEAFGGPERWAATDAELHALREVPK